ncbi:DUF305 domain-containing protein [Chitinophaga sp. 212800010-3]|uniref:DUF305 domain-containing protein n=1 Tax=unclassified Chitinophaga TaxID=2619133 RepID=UPI002DE95288|nr:DUF305 domain-containing protein [Chitinophaga sp. 212800010-3]
MKPVVQFAIGAILVSSIIACSKDDKTQIRHDEDKMMMIMHEMDKKMDTMKMTMDIDHDFSMMMILHHQTAIDMAKELLNSGKDSTLKRIAQKIIEMQSLETSQFQVFLAGHMKVPHNINGEQHMQLMMSMEKMARQADLELFTGGVDNDFATLMIPHHQSAMDMAEIEAHAGHDTAPMNLAAKIKVDQQMEIKELQEWLLNHRK